ncbi:MAG: cellulase family glycosylhydrolase [Kiritimatiellae bacterium]|nr:cellulase family glycosylhydrolase [Kiritimatiellia bacterium]
MKTYLLTIPTVLFALAIQAADIQVPPPASADAASANAVSANAAIHRGNQETQAPEATLVPIPALDWRLPKKYATIEGDRLIIDIPAEAYPADAVAEADLPAALFDGAEGFSMAIDAEGKALAKPTKGYLGLKFQFHLKENATGREAWPNTRNRIGDFQFGELRNDTTFGGGHPDSITLMLGLQGTSGRVEFDLSTLRGAPSLGLFQRINQDWIVRYPDTGMAGTPQSNLLQGSSDLAGSPQPGGRRGEPLRGVMLPGRNPTEDDFATLAEWGVTLVRYQMIRNWSGVGDNRDIPEFLSWLDGKLDCLEQVVLPCARKHGIKVVVDLHVPPGGRDAVREMSMFREKEYADAFIDIWRRIATRFKGNSDVIYGYDLINEPNQLDRALFDYWTLQRLAAEAIREIDPNTAIIMESNGWDSAATYAYLSPLAMDNVIYQVHCYTPMEFTHQGVYGAPKDIKWPDESKGWNKDFLRMTLQPVRDFEARHGAKIYVGEFSAAAWAPGAEQYLRDCISLFEEYGWDWTYHAFREASVWDVEKAGEHFDSMKPTPDTPRKQVLLEGFAAATGRQPLWPAGAMPDRQPHQIAAMTDEANTPGFFRAGHAEPYIEWFDSPAPEASNGVCAILISGGAYQNCCDVGLIKFWRERLTALGCQCVNLVYRTPRPKGLPIHQSAWEDGQRAVRLVRAQAAKRGFDPEKIVTFSMSAGSHLATLLATSALTPAYEPTDALDETPCHINAAIAFATAYGLTDGYGNPNLREGDGPDILLDPAFKFDDKTAPMCLLHGGADIYSPLASTRIYRELRKRKIPAEVHLIPDKGHGAHAFDRAVEFLRQMGILGDLGAEVQLMERYPSNDARAEYEKQKVWPEGKVPSVQTNQCEPYLEWHIPTNLTTRAIQMIWSGGSYMGNGPDGFEVAPARRFLNEKGMAVVTVRYRTPRPAAPLAKHITAWQDVQRAIRLVRSQAAERGLDPDRIGVMGSSAGGHLALMAATSSRHKAYLPIDDLDKKVPCNVQWAVCIYPAYAMTDGLEKGNSGGGNDLDARLAPEFSFDPDTPPMLFVHGDADGWAAMNSVAAWEQLRRMGIQGEVHTLAKRPHCFQRAAAPGTGSYTYLDRIWEFLSAKGFNK